MSSFKQKSPLISTVIPYQVFSSNIFVEIVQVILILYLEATVLVLKSKKILPKERHHLNVQTIIKQTW